MLGPESVRRNESSPTATVCVQLRIDGRPVEIDVAVPEGPATWEDLLPFLRALVDVSVQLGLERVQREGRTISCRNGCALCCRHIVPVAHFEARFFHDLVERMPEPGGSQVQARFSDVRGRLNQAGFSDVLGSDHELTPEEGIQLGIDYVRQMIPCPFLEDELCTIYDDRPLKCREYMVTSPAEYCGDPEAGDVDDVALPLRIFRTSLLLEQSAASRQRRWVPLSHVLELEPKRLALPPACTGPDLLNEFLTRLTGQPR